jgi:hypothetical protein
LTLPVPAINRNPFTQTLVNLATWFWVPAEQFRLWDITASAGNPEVSATVTATPSSMAVLSADGTSTTCRPPQAVTPWSAGANDAAGCTLSYVHSSANQPGAVTTTTATTTYTAAWTSTVAGAAGPGGPLAGLDRSSSVPVPVAESQALVGSIR